MMNTSRARSLMAEDQVDAVLSSTLENNFYLSGIWVGGQERYPRDTEFYVLSPADRPEAGTIVCSIGHADLVLVANDTITDVVTFGTFFRDVAEGVELYPDESRVRDITAAHEVGRPALDALVEAITRAGFGEASLAVEERGPNRELLTQLSERLPKARIQPGWSLLRRVRSVKTDAEIERVVAALRVNELGLRAALAAFEEGVTERAVQRAFQQAVVAEGARPGFTMVRFGRGLALGQVPPGATKLRRGDFAFFDVGVDLDGYKSDIGRVVSFGEPNPDLQQFFAASKAGQQTAIEMMAPGVTAGAVSDAGASTGKS
jgi:Xaa-Pro dipeptidase